MPVSSLTSLAEERIRRGSIRDLKDNKYSRVVSKERVEEITKEALRRVQLGKTTE